ncbi:YndM family protein [Paenibacillus sp. p3-SID867]|uniref:YndM family protein n=1 Tax=Paenibacillus sp. p3-SID867 TaxID=2916363 RepID=UPI0021A5865B|nr:YndM family protein [Paenibacillus sp. p3-SID867]MCT1401036.1 YndM family protein [Paenibacillus sp. p3-SID867]
MEKLLVKLLVHGVMITAILVGLSNATFASAVIAAMGIGIVAYLVGDLLILPRTNNMMATIGDVGLVFVMLWIISESANWTLSFPEILLITVLAGIFEFFYHMWLLRDHEPVQKQRA